MSPFNPIANKIRIKKSPINCAQYRTFGEIFLFVNNSIKANRINPPSRIGKGSKFMINNEMLIIPKTDSKLTIPDFRFSEKLS